MTTRVLSKISIGCVLFCLSFAVAHAGQDRGNGQFAFSKSAGAKLLKFDALILEERLGWLDEACVNERLQRLNLKPIELAKLRKIVANVRSNYLASAIGLNADGQAEPRLFTYGEDENGPYIEAEQIFFISFLMPASSGEQSGMIHWFITNALLHEASHHFGYNDREAEIFADKVGRISDSTEICKKN